MSKPIDTSNAYYCVFTFADGTRITTEANFRPEATPTEYAKYLANNDFHGFTEPDGSCLVVNMANVMAVKIMSKEKEDEYDD